MGVILLRLEGAMQSWGIGSRFTDRHTEAEPTKSGVIGLLSSALGRLRGDSINDLVELKMAVRVEREGHISYDYHATLNVLRANAKGAVSASKLGTVISRRFYIADGCFLVGLESENLELLQKILNSLKFPKWPLFLGRKSFPTCAPVYLNNDIIEMLLVSILKKYPWQGRVFETPPHELRLLYECEANEGEPRFDVPESFESRKFLSRYVKTEFISYELLDEVV